MSQAPQVSGPVKEIISCIAVSLDVAISLTGRYVSLGLQSTRLTSTTSSNFIFKPPIYLMFKHTKISEVYEERLFKDRLLSVLLS